MAASTLILSKEYKQDLDAGFAAAYGRAPERYFSAPGRTEIGGNHTDHQRGRVLAAAVNLDVRAAVALNGSDEMRVLSKGFEPFSVNINELEPVAAEINTAPSLLRGVAARFKELGCKLGGFDAYCETNVLQGSGLSSSAAFEVLMGTIINHLFFNAAASQPEIAQIGQYAENVFFGKPCGLMDQTASAVGNLVTIDFYDKEKPLISPVAFDFASCGHALCIIDTRASHAELTDEYAAIPGEIKKVAEYFGKDVLTQIDEDEFYAAIPALREKCGDRAVLRCVHFYAENKRVPLEVAALEQGDFDAFLELVKESGRSSWMYLQNVTPAGYKENQDMALALALCERYLKGRGASRVHGGGFAGTVQAFVPVDILDEFRQGIDSVLGEGACLVLSIRAQGGVEAFGE